MFLFPLELLLPLLLRRKGSLHLNDKNISISQRLSYIAFKKSLACFLESEQPAILVLESDAGGVVKKSITGPSFRKPT